ncbi:MAG: fliE [Devosia sp.]|jgi:flagellar hook-basal body complex protein FliE|uniref:flagellar hook-basal body complex protein FliE n=1 Tax=Devosia sp. TaxID=1871048 RepID=UPI0026263E69|nr:flagellar hook-basal body complex protein FliE [Devosia sp.]MDB5527836.1 fliE [Devosia sp.]
MTTVPLNAATAAYNNASQLISQVSQPSTPGNDLLAQHALQPDFAKMLSQQVQGVIDTGKTSDAMSMNMVNGKADVVDMVTALSQTEIAIESMVTVRDRVISAYEEIMRMPI